MQTLLTPSNTMFVVGMLGIIFGVYHYFRNPQIKSDENYLLLSSRYENLEKIVVNIRDNHIHTIDEKLEEQGKDINTLALGVRELTTIINERIPKRNNI